MKELPVYFHKRKQSWCALVDDEDYEWASTHKWSGRLYQVFDDDGDWNGLFTFRIYTTGVEGKKTSYLHRMVMDVDDERRVIHDNGVCHDCRKQNLTIMYPVDIEPEGDSED